jgi:dimethylargininase
VGRSERSNDAGIAQLAELLRPFGYEVQGVELHDCLHLKTAITAVAPATVLLNEAWIDVAPFAAYERIPVDQEEPFAANVLRIGSSVVMPSAFPLTRRRLEARGIAVRTVEVSEMAKAEGGVTCCSVLLDLDPELDTELAPVLRG